MDWAYGPDVFRAAQEEYERQVRDYGIEVIDLTKEQWKANAKAARAKEWPAVEETMGKEIMDLVRQNSISIN